MIKQLLAAEGKTKLMEIIITYSAGFEMFFVFLINLTEYYSLECFNYLEYSQHVRDGKCCS